jgi:hypothetical protein
MKKGNSYFWIGMSVMFGMVIYWGYILFDGYIPELKEIVFASLIMFEASIIIRSNKIR